MMTPVFLLPVKTRADSQEKQLSLSSRSFPMMQIHHVMDCDPFFNTRSRLDSMSTKRKKQIKILILFAASIGFVIQVMQVSLQYFSYETRVQVHFKFQRLESPYDTKCTNRLAKQMFKCNLKCQLEHYDPGSKIPTIEIISEPIDYKRLVSSDLEDPLTLANMDHVMKECRKRCSFDACTYSYTKTSVQTRNISDVNLAFSVRTANDPDMISLTVAAYPFVEFFSFLCGCFGIWFGVSFLSIDPFARGVTRFSESMRANVSPAFVNVYDSRPAFSRVMMSRL